MPPIRDNRGRFIRGSGSLGSGSRAPVGGGGGGGLAGGGLGGGGGFASAGDTVIERNGARIEIPSGQMAEVVRMLRDAEPEIRVTALGLAAAALAGEAAEDAPVATGLLKRSHFSEIVDDVALVGAGNGAAYAAAVHARHPTKAYWLLNRVKAGFAQAMQAALREAFAVIGGGR